MFLASRSSSFLFGLSFAALIFSGVGCSAEPDPVQLLRDSAAAVVTAPSVSVDFGVSVQIVMGEETKDDTASFAYRTAGDAFSFAPATEGDEAPSEGILITGNGGVTITQKLSRGRHTLDPGEAGFAGFIRSPLARGIGNGLGGLALSFLSAEAMEDLADEVTASEHLGIEPIDDVPHYHVRYTVEESLVWDVWIAAEGKPLVRRIVPDLSEMKASSAAAQRFDNFDYSIEFDFTSWNTDAGLTAENFRVVEPDGSFFVESFYGRPAEAPHALLGEDAPAFELSNLEGEPVNLSDHLGKDIVMLDFWATWCPPCIAALPAVTEIANSLADRGVAFYAVNQQEDAETIDAFLKQRGLESPVLLDAEGVAGNAYMVEGLPTSVIIGRDGKVQVVHVGFGGNFETMLRTELESLADGEDLAAVKLTEWREKDAKRRERIERLRTLLDE